MCDCILPGHPSSSKWTDPLEEKSQINLVGEVIRHSKDSQVPGPQMVVSEAQYPLSNLVW